MKRTKHWRKRVTMKYETTIHRHGNVRTVTPREAKGSRVCDPAVRSGKTSEVEQTRSRAPPKPGTRKNCIAEGRPTEARTRREKARIPFPESGGHKLPQCGRFRDFESIPFCALKKRNYDIKSRTAGKSPELRAFRV